LDNFILGLPRRWKKKVALATMVSQDLTDLSVEKSLRNLSLEIERVKKVIIEAQP
jgi:hypothetical protein